MDEYQQPRRTFEEMARARFGQSIDEYARGVPELESHAIQMCYPAIAALELDESYASLVITARMDNELSRIIEHGAGRQGNAMELLYGSNKPLSTFSAKINMAYFLGFLTPKMFAAINCCRKVRNVYAHFDSPDEARNDKDYQKSKKKLLDLDRAYTTACVRKLRSVSEIQTIKKEQIDVFGVTAIMVAMCDSLAYLALSNRVYAERIKPPVVPAIYGFEFPDLGIGK